MDPDLFPFSKFKILFINLFSILYKASTLNLYKLQSDLREIEHALDNSSEDVLLPKILIIVISLLLMAKFLFGYLSLAANVIAIFPILSDDQPELLLPTIVSQAVENILLSIVEIVLGYVTCKYYIAGRMSMFAIFIMKMIIKMSLGVSTLNVYSDLYNQLKFPLMYSSFGGIDSMNTITKTSEKFIRKQYLV